MKEQPARQPLSLHDVITFGADPSGTRDSSGALQAALNEAMEGPCRSVYLPDGTYRIDSGLTINKGSPDDTWNVHVFSDGGAILLAKAGITVFTVQGCRYERCENPVPRRVHFRRLHLIRNGADSGDGTNECGFKLGSPECRLDDVEISGFRGAGVRLHKAELTSLHRCRLWHNRVNVEDLGSSQASELMGCRLIFASETGLIWNSRGLTVTGGAIEMNTLHEVTVGTQADSIARFYGVHFEHNNNSPPREPMIVCGRTKEPANVQVSFDRCAFFGNGTERLAISCLGLHTCEVIASWFQHFATPRQPPIEQKEGASGRVVIRDLIVLPKTKTECVNQ